MNASDLLVNLWRAVESAGGKPTINSVIIAASGFGLKIRRGEAYRILTPFRYSSNTLREHKNTHTGTHREQVGNVPRADTVKVSSPKLILPPTPNGVVPPVPKRVRPIIEPVVFEPEDERRVAGMLAIAAAENKTRTLSVDRVLGMRAEMRALLDEWGQKTWRYAIDEALSRAKPLPYARAVAKGQREIANVLPFGPVAAGRFANERPVDDCVAAAIAKASRR